MLYVCKCVNKTNAKQIFISLWAHIEKDYALAQINSTGVSTLSSQDKLLCRGFSVGVPKRVGGQNREISSLGPSESLFFGCMDEKQGTVRQEYHFWMTIRVDMKVKTMLVRVRGTGEGSERGEGEGGSAGHSRHTTQWKVKQKNNIYSI